MHFSAEADFAIYFFSFLFIASTTAAALIVAYLTVQEEL